MRDYFERLGECIRWCDSDLDANVSDEYKAQPLAQDWARVAKVTEEAGEAIDALIAVTGNNPRKGEYGELEDLLTELADVTLVGMYAMQHFVKNPDIVLAKILGRAQHHVQRRVRQIEEEYS